MADVLGEGVIRIRSDTSGFESSTRSSILGTVGKVGGAAAGLFAGFKVFDFVKDSVIGFNSTLEQSRSAFTNLLGSGDAANKMLADLQDFAKTTPFAFEQLIPVSQQLVGALGKSVDVTATMRELGDAVSATGGSGEKLNQLTLAYTQLATSGTAHLGDLMQINNAVPGALARMAQSAGMSVGDFRDHVSKGLISSGEAVKLFHNITTDPKFGIAGGMDAQSKTFAGAMSNIGDALQQGLAQAGAPIFEFISRLAKGFALFLGTLQSSGLDAAVKQAFGGTAVTALHVFEAVLQTIIGTVKLVVSAGQSLIGFFQDSSTALTILLAAGALVAGFALGWQLYTAAVSAWAAVVRIATAVQTTFNLVMAANPIVLVAIAIAALIAALVILYLRVQVVHDAVNAAFSFLRSFVPAVLAAVSSVISAFVSFVSGLWQRFGGTITAYATNAFNTIMGVIRGYLNIIKGIINVFIGLFTGDWGRMWNGIKQIASGALGVLRSILSGAIGALGILARSIGQAILDGIVNLVKQIPGKVGALIRGIPGAIGDVAHLLYNAGLSIATGLLDGLKAGFNAVKDEVSGWGSSIASLKGPLNVDRVLLTPAGDAIVQGLHDGLSRSFPKVEALVGSFAGSIQRAAVVGQSLQPLSAPLTALPAPARGSTLPGLLGASDAGAGGITINGDVIVRAEHPAQLADELNAAAERAR